MRYVIFLFSLLLACSSPSDKNSQSQPDFPIDSIIKITKAPINTVEIQEFDLELLPKIDSVFFSKYFDGLPIEGTDTSKLRFDYLQYWYFVDHRDVGDHILISILNDNEIGYALLYYLVYDKTSKNILSVNALSSYEGDGGYYNADSLVWTTNKFICYSISSELEEFNDSIAIQSSDSSCIEYALTNNKFIGKTIYSYPKKDTLDLRDLEEDSEPE